MTAGHLLMLPGMAPVMLLWPAECARWDGDGGAHRVDPAR
jgi:hypothetical protein